MHADIHIDDFCRDAALIITHLYNAFPLPLSLYVDDIYGPEETDEVGLHSKRYRACLGTMLWLADEGILRYQSMVYQQGIDQALLTNRAFSLLTSFPPFAELDVTDDAPASLKREARSWIGQVRAALHEGYSEKITVTMQDLLRQFLHQPAHRSD